MRFKYLKYMPCFLSSRPFHLHMGRQNPAPSQHATPQQLAQHAKRAAEAAEREASRPAQAAASDQEPCTQAAMPNVHTFFRSQQSLSPGEASDYLSSESALPSLHAPASMTPAPDSANAAADVALEGAVLAGGNAAGALIAAVAPGATGGTGGHAPAGGGGGGAGAALSSQPFALALGGRERGTFNWQTPGYG